AAGWTQLPTGFRYRDPTLARGPVRKAVIRARRLAKVLATGSGIGFTLDEPTQGHLGVVLATGGHRYCTLFGGVVRRDAPGRSNPRARHRVVVGLALRNRDVLDAFLAEVHDPASPNYGRFLSQAEFDALFAPTQDDEARLVHHLVASGLEVTERTPNRLLVA